MTLKSSLAAKLVPLALLAYLALTVVALDSEQAAGSASELHDGHSLADCAEHTKAKQQVALDGTSSKQLRGRRQVEAEAKKLFDNVSGQISSAFTAAKDKVQELNPFKPASEPLPVPDVLAGKYDGKLPKIRRRRQAPSSPSGGASNSPSSFFSALSELGPQVEKAKAFSSMFSSSSSGPAAGQPASPTGSASPAQLMSSLSELIRSTQDKNAKMVSDAQQSVQQAQQQAQQQTAQAAQNAQGGIQAALTEIGQGLQRIASNNPSLLPDVKNLYQSVSSKLSSASTSVVQAAPTNNNAIVPAKNSEQLADNLGKVVLNGLQTPA